jgi:AraC-like DNA-binding protein
MMGTETDNHDRGILQAEAAKQKFRLTRYEPAEDLRYFVRRYWVTEWDLRGQDPYPQIMLAHPNINMVIEPRRTRVYGISKSTYSHWLHGEGRVLGVKFRLGAFYPFWNQPLSKLANQSMDSRDVFGAEAMRLEGEVLSESDELKKVAILESFLRERLPEKDGNIELLNGIVDIVSKEREIVRVDDMVYRFGLNIRSLQRLFSRYVGVSPKWVIRRYRMHEAATRIERGEANDWKELSLELGYYDQAHFNRDFKNMIGRTPEEYAKAVHKAREPAIVKETVD